MNNPDEVDKTIKEFSLNKHRLWRSFYLDLFENTNRDHNTRPCLVLSSHTKRLGDILTSYNFHIAKLERELHLPVTGDSEDDDY